MYNQRFYNIKKGAMELLLIAFALAMDSVALSISNGAKYPNFKFAQIARVAFFYAAAQFIMPLAGYALGMAVGVTFAFGEINILYACCVIGLVCFALCVAACYAGKLTGEYLHSKALVLGGVILILIGVKILLSHLGVIDI